MAAVVHGVRTAAAAGCRAIVLTNGCGGLKETWTPGTPVLISDHINLTGRSPIEGANFVDLTDLYSSRLRQMCREVEPSLDEGIYVQFPGPHYETPAEIGMVRAIGGHLVGMSTTLEAIAAREAGMEVLGISLVTNLAAGISGEPLNHEEVLEAGATAASRMGELARSDRAEDLMGDSSSQAEETRQRLIEAATREFAEHGVHAASLLEVTRQAGQRNRGAVHYHFGSREGMLVAVLESGSTTSRSGSGSSWRSPRSNRTTTRVGGAGVRPAGRRAERPGLGGPLLPGDPRRAGRGRPRAPRPRRSSRRSSGPAVGRPTSCSARATPPMPEALRAERLSLVIGFILRAAADRARARERSIARPQLETEQFIANLVAMVIGMLTSPIPGT